MRQSNVNIAVFYFNPLTDMKSSRRIKLLNIGRAEGILVATSIAVSFLILEIVLRMVRPIPVLPVGTDSPNARLYGWGYAPGATILQRHPDTGEEFYTVANSGGWKDVEHQLEKEQGTIRILILGDSNTFGLVPLEANYPRVLERLLGEAGFKVEVITMAYGGWSTDQALVALKHAGLSYHPDIVISQFDTNDISENLTREDIALFKPFRFYVKDDTLEMRTVEPELPISDQIRRWLFKSHVLFYMDRARVHLMRRIRQIEESQVEDTGLWWRRYEDPESQEAWLLYEKLLEEMKRVVEENGAVFYLFNEVEEGHLVWDRRAGKIHQDENGQDYVIQDGKKYFYDFYEHVECLKEVTNRIGVDMIPNKRVYIRFDRDPHPNEEGNLKMAEDIFEFLITDDRASQLLQQSKME